LIICWRFVGGMRVYCLNADGRDRQQTASWVRPRRTISEPIPDRRTARPGRVGLAPQLAGIHLLRWPAAEPVSAQRRRRVPLQDPGRRYARTPQRPWNLDRLPDTARAVRRRRRVQRAVNRRFNRARYDANQTMMAFAARLKDAVDLNSVRNDLTRVVYRVLEPAHPSVWIIHRDCDCFQPALLSTDGPDRVQSSTGFPQATARAMMVPDHEVRLPYLIRHTGHLTLRLPPGHSLTARNPGAQDHLWRQRSRHRATL
jgi:hypothetical protein